MNIVFVVCHPDDEALWIGGILCELPQFDNVRASVICVSGRDENSPREREFVAAQRVAGYQDGVVLGLPLRPALEPLPFIPDTVTEGLDRLTLSPDEIDLLITHAPYGDEHHHPHHCQAYVELRAWTRERRVPFGFFSCIPVPDIAHVPVETRFRRLGALHLLNRSRCEWPAGVARPDMECPVEYVQFGTDLGRKRKMLNCYQSINLAQHESGYAAFTTNCEGIYASDPEAIAAIDAIVSQMPAPGTDVLIPRHTPAPPPSLPRRVARKLRTVVGA